MGMDENEVKRYHDEMLRTFARGVAHNFNNILTAGMGFLALAMDMSENRDALAMLRNVELCHQRISNLSRQLLAFTGDEQAAIGAVSLYDILRNSLNLFDSIALKHRALMMCDFSPVRDMLVNADEFRLVQVLVQLLKNAAESLDGNRGRISFRAHPKGDRAVIEISDSGAGIPPEEIEKICAPFYTTKQIVGVGLGLSMAKSTVESFGGTLEITSKVGSGTTVRVSLPLANYTENGYLNPTEDLHLRAGLNVLVAVDAEQTRQALEAVLMSYSVNVKSVECEEDMLKELKTGRIKHDALIVDLLHCDHFGDELIAFLRRFTQIPLLALYTTRAEKPQETEDVGALAKPFDPGDLLLALRGFKSLLEPEA